MQSLHRGSFCAQDGEKPVEGSDVYPSRCRRETRRDPWNFSSYLRLVYHKVL